MRDENEGYGRSNLLARHFLIIKASILLTTIANVLIANATHPLALLLWLLEGEVEVQ